MKNDWIGVWGSHLKPEGFRSIKEYPLKLNLFPVHLYDWLNVKLQTKYVLVLKLNIFDLFIRYGLGKVANGSISSVIESKLHSFTFCF